MSHPRLHLAPALHVARWQTWTGVGHLPYLIAVGFANRTVTFQIDRGGCLWGSRRLSYRTTKSALGKFSPPLESGGSRVGPNKRASKKRRRFDEHQWLGALLRIAVEF